HGVCRRADFEEESFVQLERGGACDDHGDRFGGLAGVERERAARCLVVAVRHQGRAVGRGVADRGGPVGRARTGHGEGEGRRAGVAFELAHVVDRQRRQDRGRGGGGVVRGVGVGRRDGGDGGRVGDRVGGAG